MPEKNLKLIRWFYDNTDLRPDLTTEDIHRMLEEEEFEVVHSESQEIHLWNGDGWQYLTHTRQRLERAIDFQDPQNKELAERIADRLFHHHNMKWPFPSLLRVEGYFLARKGA